MCHFVLVFFSPFSITITSLWEERANLSAFRTFVRFVLVWICRFPIPLGSWEGLRFVIVALPGLFSYLFFRTVSRVIIIIIIIIIIKDKRKIQGVPQSQTAALPRHQEALPRHQEEEETDVQTSTNGTNVRKV